jgi:two-component system, sensor histidine kinase and response regulator
MVAGSPRAEPRLGRPALVLLTSRGERLPAATLATLGLAACELKPIRAARLAATLARALLDHSAPPEKTPASAAAAKRHPGLPILVAEDNVVNQKVTRLLLHNLGYTAEIAANGREAVDALHRRRFALVLMDAQMPVLDGIEATREIRQAQLAGELGENAGVRIVAMTANAMAGDREACLAAGMDDYLAKPVKPDALRAMLDRHLASAEPVCPAG